MISALNDLLDAISYYRSKPTMIYIVYLSRDNGAFNVTITGKTIKVTTPIKDYFTYWKGAIINQDSVVLSLNHNNGVLQVVVNGRWGYSPKEDHKHVQPLCTGTTTTTKQRAL